MKVDFPFFYEQYNLKSLTVEEITYIISRSPDFKEKIRQMLTDSYRAGMARVQSVNHEPDLPSFVNLAMIDLLNIKL